MLYRNRPYAGKKESKWAKHVIIAIIAITAVVSLWTLLLSNYIIIDQNGVRLSFINKPPAPVPTDDGGFTVVIVTPTATPIIPTEAPVEEKYGVIDAMYLDGSELRANGAQKVLSHYNNGTINAVVINMKDKEGVSYFDYETGGV